MKENIYTFRSWHNGAGMEYRFDVTATTYKEAEDKAYGVVMNVSGVDPDVDFEYASVPVYAIYEPYLDFVIDICDTKAEAEEGIQECYDWDRENPQGYVPYYVAREIEPRTYRQRALRGL